MNPVIAFITLKTTFINSNIVMHGAVGAGVWELWCSTTMSAVDFERRLEGGRGVEFG